MATASLRFNVGVSIAMADRLPVSLFILWEAIFQVWQLVNCPYQEVRLVVVVNKDGKLI
jgi:hypothetical protein